MSNTVGASDARSALTAVEHSRQQVIAEIDMPRWYWLGLAAGWIGLGIIADVGPGWLVVAATLVSAPPTPRRHGRCCRDEGDRAR
jgi:hypothetical protein